MWRSGPGSQRVDVVAQPLGFRWFSVDPDKGFFLNGRHYDLHGVSFPSGLAGQRLGDQRGRLRARILRWRGRSGATAIAAFAL